MKIMNNIPEPMDINQDFKVSASMEAYIINTAAELGVSKSES